MLLCAGTSHRFVTVRVLEHAARESASLRSAFENALTSGRPAFPFRELAVLATCNRVELYAACDPADATRAAALLRTTLDGSGEDTHIYVHHARDALRHLCRVTAGLDSLVLGEPQIAGQVARAFQELVRADHRPAVLASAAALARKVGRRARAETAIARGPLSISSVAVRLAAERMGGLAGKRILVLGAGKIGHVTCQVLRTSSAHVTVANRTLAHAQALAHKVGAVAVPLHPLPDLLGNADAVIASTASPTALIEPDTVHRALALRRSAGNRLPLLLIDIAVPCNVDDRVRGMDDVELAGIDDLRSRVSAHMDERRAEVPRVEALIEEELTGAMATLA